MSHDTVDLRLLGGALLADAGGELTGSASQRHPLALLALLATAPERTLTRGKLAGLIWPEAPEATARSRLNTHVYRIRTELGEAVLLTDGDNLRLNRKALDCDVWRFERAVEADEFERAADQYRGPFLDGFRLKGAAAFEKRIERVRTRLRASYHATLEALAESAESRSEPEEAARWWRERANDDPYDGRVIRRLMESLASADNRAGALQVAELHARLVREELGTEPSADVGALAESLRKTPGLAKSPPKSRGPAGPGPGEEAPPPESLPGPARRRRWSSVALVGLLVFAAAGTGWYVMAADPVTVSSDPPSAIAVLPLTRVGQEDPAGLAEGLHADLLTRLAQVPGLQVVSSTSVQPYRESGSSVPAIAADLGVSWILEGTVQRSADRIHVNAQLIDARSDTHVWAESYHREVSPAGLFDIQADLTRRIADALEVSLTVRNRRDRAGHPTDDLAAYDFMARGRVYFRRSPGSYEQGRNDFRTAVRLFDRAIERDSGFAEAWTRKAQSHMHLYWLSGLKEEDQLRKARTAVARAWKADPGGPWGHLARAELHRLLRENERAYEHYEATGLLTAEVLSGQAQVRQAQSRLTEAAELYERLRALDPRNHDRFYPSWITYGLLRRYEKVVEVLDRVLELAPDRFDARYQRALLPLFATGEAEAVGPPADTDFEVRWRLGDHRSALADDFWDEFPWRAEAQRVWHGLILADMGDTAAARRELEAARIELEGLVRRDSIPQYLGFLGLAYAGLGRHDAALAVARRAVERAREKGIFTLGSVQRHQLAIVQTLVGKEEAAIATLEEYLSNPGIRSFACVATHPILRRLRDHSSFTELERRFGT